MQIENKITESRDHLKTLSLDELTALKLHAEVDRQIAYNKMMITDPHGEENQIWANRFYSHGRDRHYIIMEIASRKEEDHA